MIVESNVDIDTDVKVEDGLLTFKFELSVRLPKFLTSLFD